MTPHHHRSFTAALLVLVAAIQFASSADAAVTVYTSRATWLTAIGAPTFSQDFSGVLSDTPFHTAPLVLGNLTFSREGPEAGLTNYIDALPLTFASGSGTNQAELFVNAIEGVVVGTNVRIAFSSPVTAFGLDVWEAGNLEGARIDLYNGGAQLRTQQLPAGYGDFIGYDCSAGDTATSVLFRSNSLIVGTTGEGFAIDNLAGVVPEPAAGVLVLLASAALIGRRRPRRN